jgi:predicted nucleotidyltransferase component of viral defense system
MITEEKIRELATKYRMPVTKNVTREYLQHLFLSYLYEFAGAENIMFKGGTALRIIYGSPRFSEDLDFSLFNVASHESFRFIEDRLQDTLKGVEQLGIDVDLGAKTGSTTWGYRGEATFSLHGQSIILAIDVSGRNSRHIEAEMVTITSDYIPTYNLHHLPKRLLVEEKIDALFKRHKPRDFYDLYFMLRKGLVEADQKDRLVKAKKLIEETKIDFKTELENLLPKDHHAIIGQLKDRLLDELNRQINL